jgi:hypothetical protein
MVPHPLENGLFYECLFLKDFMKEVPVFVASYEMVPFYVFYYLRNILILGVSDDIKDSDCCHEQNLKEKSYHHFIHPFHPSYQYTTPLNGYKITKLLRL